MLPTLDKVASALVGDSPFLANTLRYAVHGCFIMTAGSMSSNDVSQSGQLYSPSAWQGREPGYVQGGQERAGDIAAPPAES